MLNNLANYFTTTGFMPHGHCFVWTPSLLWIYVVSDLIIAASYFSIPFALWYFAQKRPDVPFRWIFLMFGAFVLACGTTHLFAVWNIWHADYWADAGIKALTASASAATAMLLWPLIPKALTIPSHMQLENANRELQGEVARRKRAESALLVANEALERRVAERTADFEATGNSLRESEARFRSLTEMSSDFFWETDAGHRLTHHGSAGKKTSTVSGFERGAQIGERRWDMPYLAPDEAGWQAHRAVLAAREPFRNFELARLGVDGSTRHFSISGDPAFDATGTFTGYRGVGTDITERKEAEAKIQRLTQLYAALSQCNEAIVRCASEEELFPQICRVAVQFGGMKMARVSIADPDACAVYAVAGFGQGADDLQDHRVSTDADSEFGRGPTGTAIREHRPVWCQDLLNDPALAPWYERALRLGVRSVAALPLRRNGVVIGAFTVFYGEVNAFDESLRKLFLEMAVDIGFALDNFAREAARARAEQDLRAAEEQFRGLVEQSIAGTYIIQDGKFTYVNPRFLEIFGYDAADELIGRDATLVVAEQDRGMVLENMRLRIEGEVTNVNYSFTAVRKDGAMIDIGVHGTRATRGDRPAIIGLVQDISEKKRADEQIRRYVAQLETAFMSTVEVATTLSELRDPYTAGHERRVGKIAAAIGAELGFDKRRIEGLQVAGYLHDIGKIIIPAEILSKPGKLSPIEFELIKGHPQSSYDVLKDVDFPWPVAAVALQHHERMDGSGYPRGLEGEAILLEARIMAVADVIEAMSSHRPYRAGLGIEAALAEIARGRGSAYDTAVADACLKLFREGHYNLPE